MPHATISLKHPTLASRLHGKEFPATVQYRNLKYASIPGRWKHSVPLNGLSSRDFDATKFGPACPHKKGAWKWDLGLVGNEVLPTVEAEGQGEGEVMDEFECLNLVVTVPKVRRREKLPVFVWVHGGGLSMGSNSCPQYDLQNFVARSAEIGKPIIGVAINYRVSILGFLASSELGITGNFGYRDQINAFRWVRKHIAGFGGDPENVTACGESAGGISISTLLIASDGSLFDRAVIMSGEATLRKPRAISWHDGLYADQLKLLELDGVPKNERIQKMFNLPVEVLGEKLPMAQHFCACIDGDFLREDVLLSKLSNPKTRFGKPAWCKEIVIGDCLHDGTVLSARISSDPSAFSRLLSLCKTMLSSAETEALLSAYNLHPTKSRSAEEVSRNLMVLSSELRFHLPALAVAEGWGKEARRYHFHARNPVKGVYEGLASHELDVAFLFQNFNYVLPSENVEIAKEMADRFIGFVYGEEWVGEDEVMVFGDEKVEIVRREVYDKDKRSGRGALLRSIGYDRCFWLAEKLQQVRREEDTSILKAKL